MLEGTLRFLTARGLELPEALLRGPVSHGGWFPHLAMPKGTLQPVAAGSLKRLYFC